MIGNNCVLSNAKVGPFVTIGDDATLENCSISESICLDHAVIRDLTRPVVDSVIGQYTRLMGNDPRVEQTVRLILGDHSKMSITE
jgi:glucose-1-phosphate thymidylyltransferase